MSPLGATIIMLVGSASIPRFDIPGFATSLLIIQSAHLPEQHATTAWAGFDVGKPTHRCCPTYINYQISFLAIPLSISQFSKLG